MLSVSSKRMLHNFWQTNKRPLTFVYCVIILFCETQRFTSLYQGAKKEHENTETPRFISQKCASQRIFSENKQAFARKILG